MKKLLVISVLLLIFSVVTPGYAGSVDGIWALNDSNQELSSFAMLRENSGSLLMTNLELAMDDWQAFFGPFDGTTADLTVLASRWEMIGFTCTFLSSDTASCVITSCSSTASAQCDSGSVGSAFSLQKLF